MSKAPERIYLDGDVEAGDGMFPRCFESPKYASEPQVEYVRADRIEELEAGNQRLRLEVAHANDTANAAIERIEELEKQNASLEAKLAVVSHNATAFGHKIVSLESARDKAWKTCLDATTKGMELEAKLAIAVNALEDVNTFGDCGLQHIVRPALAKIKGEQP